MKNSGVFIFLGLTGIALIASLSLSAQQTDPFYLNVFEKAQKSFLAGDYPEAARQFEIAAFGLIANKDLQVKAKVYLGLCQYYLNDLAASERSLREAAELIGDRDFASLEIYESVRPDLKRLTTFFNLAAPQNESLPLAAENPALPGSKAQGTNAGESAKRLREKTTKETPKDKGREKAETLPADLNIDELKEGDLVPLDLVETKPVLIKSIPAVYPAYARPLRIEGTVIVNALVSEKGDVVETELVQGIKNAVGFDQAAQKAVRQWKFEPASVKGTKVKVWMHIAIEFKRSSGASE